MSIRRCRAALQSSTVATGRPLGRAVGMAVTAVLVAAGCSSGSSNGDQPDTTSLLPPGAEALVGRYAHYDVVAYQDKSMKTLVISTGFADLELRDGKLWNVQRFCHADMGSDQKIDIAISDTATRAIVPVDTPVEVSLAGDKLRVLRPATPTAIGIKLNDPAREVLPADPKDPRIFDADGDGHPGVTSTVKVGPGLEGEIYLARREIFSYDVTQTGSDRLEGSITDNSEQLVIGASNPIFATSAQWKQVPLADRNPVIWQRVDSSWDCDRLAAERATLFPSNPKADW